jgi:hypothetical protein
LGGTASFLASAALPAGTIPLPGTNFFSGAMGLQESNLIISLITYPYTVWLRGLPCLLSWRHPY